MEKNENEIYEIITVTESESILCHFTRKGFWLDGYFLSEDGLCCNYFDEVCKKRIQC
jgi:hypothetical protein